MKYYQIDFSFFDETCSKILSRHPKTKINSIESSLSEDVFKKCGKQEKVAGTAIKAGARKLAYAYYNVLTKGTEYVEQGVHKYEEQIKQREIQTLHKLENKHKFKLIENQKAAPVFVTGTPGVNIQVKQLH